MRRDQLLAILQQSLTSCLCFVGKFLHSIGQLSLSSHIRRPQNSRFATRLGTRQAGSCERVASRVLSLGPALQILKD